MRALVLSDIHANATALEAILTAETNIDQIWCLGDVVGYGPDPNRCVDLLRSLPNLTCILGNHDAAVTGIIPLATFNPEARASINWTKSTLSAVNVAWLNALPESSVQEDATLAHGSPRNPVWEYLLDPLVAALSFDFFTTRLCFVGHTHLPVVFSQNSIGRPAHRDVPVPGEPYRPVGRAILNPGSAGQPRDRDPRACYGVYDSEANLWHARRIAYNIREVQERMRALSLPARLAVRLAEGW